MGLRDVRERDRALAASFLDVQIAEMDSAHFQRGNPSLAIGEAVFAIVSLITRPFAPAAQRGSLGKVTFFVRRKQPSRQLGQERPRCNAVDRYAVASEIERWRPETGEDTALEQYAKRLIELRKGIGEGARLHAGLRA